MDEGNPAESRGHVCGKKMRTVGKRDDFDKQGLSKEGTFLEMMLSRKQFWNSWRILRLDVLKKGC